MKHSSIQSLTTVPLALAGAALLVLPPSAVSPALPEPEILSAAVRLLSGESAFAPVDSTPAAGQGVALMMGGSGVPWPAPELVQWAFEHYSEVNGANFGDYVPLRVFIPNGGEPAFGGIHALQYDTSVAQGVEAVEARINEELMAGHPVVVGGVSQSSNVDSVVLRDIADGRFVPDYSNVPAGTTPLQFLLLGNPSNPNGGFLERFHLPEDPAASVTSVGLTFDGAAATDTGIPVTSYCLEYDPNCDFPVYTQNLISNLNAMAGWALVHPYYIDGVAGPGLGVTPDQIANAIELQTSEGYDGGSTFYMMPWQDQLPLATVIQAIAGKPLADLLEPDLRVLANLGYGTDPYTGWSTSPADVATTLQASPHLTAEEFNTILGALWDGAKEGFHDFTNDLLHPAADSGGLLSGLLGGGGDMDAPHSLAEMANGFSKLLTDLYSLVLPVQDIVNALTVALPAHELTVLTNSLMEGQSLGDALSLTSAFATGLESLAGGFLAIVGLNALPDIQADLAQIF
ncbi:PE-PPE domain-containing protein [Mycolicibacter heraklionensis]|uniref:PE-PPE domain-containing protein n=1 Tax=Mycolicibacter heraklionensis TaxID=512402 RepID=A0A9X7WHR7_9MYCO|nr:PE-PPE domain-containing protein [Mycolicibacter heraklionensis]QZA08117.1 PE-PPE domain-containing protein [Mycolicibacter heraklionensis]